MVHNSVESTPGTWTWQADTLSGEFVTNPRITNEIRSPYGVTGGYTCLTVQTDGSLPGGYRLALRPCHGSLASKWYVQYATTGLIFESVEYPGKCLGSGPGPTGFLATLHPCDVYDPDQNWVYDNPLR
jgi:hypothetical protein